MKKKSKNSSHKIPNTVNSYTACLKLTVIWPVPMSLIFLTSIKTKNTLPINSFTSPSKLGRGHWYREHSCSAIKIKLTFYFIPRPRKNIKPSAYSTDYVQNICDKTNSIQERTASCTVQKNNWLLPDFNLFSKHHDKNIGFVFLLVIKYYLLFPLTQLISFSHTYSSDI